MTDEKLYHEHLHGPLARKMGHMAQRPRGTQGGDMQRRTMRQTTYEYLWPFEYPNFTIRSTWWGRKTRPRTRPAARGLHHRRRRAANRGRHRHRQRLLPAGLDHD